MPRLYPSVEIGPRTGTLAYFNAAMELCDPVDAVSAKLVCDNGDRVFYRVAAVEKAVKYTEDQPRDERGRFGETGGGDHGTEASGPTGDGRGSVPAAAAQAPGRPDANVVVQREANLYAQTHGLGAVDHSQYAQVDQKTAGEIADAFDALPMDDSQNPEVRAAYGALAREVEEQYDFAQAQGMTFEPWKKDGQPYQTSTEMAKDVKDNRHLFFYTGGEVHPFMGHVDPKSGLTSNDKFRAIHDYFGHAAGGYGFGPRGEENAWLVHSQMFGASAKRAMTTETRGQNSWVNFGRQNYNPDGTHKNIPAAERPYAAQKTALLPARFLAKGLKYSPDQPRDDHGRFGESGGGGTFGESAGGEVVPLYERLMKPDGGFTINMLSGSEVAIGQDKYAVSMPGAELVLKADDVKSPLDIYQYIQAHQADLQKPGNYFGGWHDPESHQLYLDVSNVVDTPEQAAKLATDHHQIAYFDFKHGQSVRVGEQAHGKDGRTRTRSEDSVGGHDGVGDAVVVQGAEGARSHRRGNRRATRAGASRSTVAALNILTALLKYSEDQARDELGRWADEGGPVGADSTDTSTAELSAAQLQVQATAAYAHIDKLVDKAVAGADFSTVPGTGDDDEDGLTPDQIHPKAKSTTETPMDVRTLDRLADVLKYDDAQPRDDAGRWTDGGGGSSAPVPASAGGHPADATTGGVIPGDKEKHDALTKQWAQYNNQLLAYVDRPDAPEAKEIAEKMKDCVKEMYTLHADSGGLDWLADRGKPGGPRDVVIIGAGPGGLQSAIMGGSDGLDTLVIDGSDHPGGQSKFSSRIENFPGFPVGVSGERLSHQMFDQAQRMGAETKLGVRVTGMSYNADTDLKTLTLSNGERVEARSVIIAGGVQFNKMEFPGAESHDVVYGDARVVNEMGAGKPVVILGGANSAGQAALSAAMTASSVTVLSRSPIEKGMSNYVVNGLRQNMKINVIEGKEVSHLLNDAQGHTQSLVTKDGKAIDCNVLGVFIGSKPETSWLPKEIKRHPGTGAIHAVSDLAAPNALETSMPGVFAIGDNRVGGGGRIAIAVGEGATASRNIFNYFNQVQAKRNSAKPKVNH